MQATLNANEQQYKKPSVGATIGGVAAGWAVNGLTGSFRSIVSSKMSPKLTKLSDDLSLSEFAKVQGAIFQTIEKSGLKDKGVEIVRASTENTEEAARIMRNELDGGVIKLFPKVIKDYINEMFLRQVETGQNAFYATKSNKIIMPERKLSLALFHEAGHAMNANLSKFGKVLQKCRPLTVLALPIAAIALFKTKKAPNEKPENGLDKATTFIKENAGKLTFATFLPVLLEEGLATLKGNKFAKQLLGDGLGKKVAKTNKYGFITYLATATFASLGIYLGTKVKDAIAHKKPIEAQKV